MKLNGSEKQVAWAQDIIDEAESAIKSYLDTSSARLAEFPESARYQYEVEACKVTLAGYEKMVAFFDGKPDNAKTIIDRRDRISSRMINKQIGDLVNMALANGKLPVVK